MSEKHVGRCKWFNDNQGFGFLINETGEDVFVHHRAIQMEGFKTLADNQRVRFTQIKTDRGWQAQEVELLEPEPA